MLLSRRAISAPTQITVTPKQYDTACVCMCASTMETDTGMWNISGILLVLLSGDRFFFYSILTPEIALYITQLFSQLSAVGRHSALFLGPFPRLLPVSAAL